MGRSRLRHDDHERRQGDAVPGELDELPTERQTACLIDPETRVGNPGVDRGVRAGTLPVDLRGGFRWRLGVDVRRYAPAIGLKLPVIEVVSDLVNRRRDIGADGDVQHDLIIRARVAADDLRRAAPDQQYDAGRHGQDDQGLRPDSLPAAPARLAARDAREGHGVLRSKAGGKRPLARRFYRITAQPAGSPPGRATQVPAAIRLANESRSRCIASSDAAARSSPISAAPTTGTCRSTRTSAPGNSAVIRLVPCSMSRALPAASTPPPSTTGTGSAARPSLSIALLLSRKISPARRSRMPRATSSPASATCMMTGTRLASRSQEISPRCSASATSSGSFRPK